MKSNRMMGCAANAWFARCLFLLISLTLLMVLMPSAHAAELPEVCYCHMRYKNAWTIHWWNEICSFWHSDLSAIFI